MAKNTKQVKPKAASKSRTTRTSTKAKLEAAEAQLEASQRSLQALALQVPGANAVTTGQQMVGIRNISSNTIGLKSPFKTEADVQLLARFGRNDPSEVAVISWAWWQQLRNDKVMRNGMIMRDDSVLGGSYRAGPADKPKDLPASWTPNAIIDPIEWIESKNETELRAAIAAITAKSSLRRLRATVDNKIREIQAATPGDSQVKAKTALQSLPMIYQLVDQLTTSRIEDE